MGLKTPYEGTRETIELSDGAPRLVRISRTFLEEHRRLKLQVKVVGIVPGERVKLHFDSVSIVEDLPSLEKRFDGQMLLAVANQDRKSTRLNSSHYCASRMTSSASKKTTLLYTNHLSSEVVHNHVRHYFPN